MRVLIPLLFAFLLCSLPGCEKETEKKSSISAENAAPTDRVDDKAQPVSAVLLAEAVETTVVELPTQAIPTWRQHKDLRPTMVVFSNEPLFYAIPALLAERAKELTENGTREDFWNTSLFTSSDPVLTPEMAVRSAAAEGFFSKVVWIVPVAEENLQEFTLETLRSYLINNKVLNEAEAGSMQQTLAGIEWFSDDTLYIAAPSTSLPQITGPAIVHLHGDFFGPLYKSEVKTPLFPLIHRQILGMRETNWETLSVTLSYANFGDKLPVESRFLIPTLASFFADPTLVDAEIPELWTLRSANLYLDTFFQPDKALENTKKMLSLAPDDASVRFDHYTFLLKSKDNDNAMQTLAEAVALDRAYALKYLELAEVAKQGNRPIEALHYLELARTAFPEDPVIELRTADLYAKTGKAGKGREIFEKLNTLIWSEVYYPDVKNRINEVLSGQ